MRIIVLLGFCLSGVYSQSRLPNPAGKIVDPTDADQRRGKGIHGDRPGNA